MGTTLGERLAAYRKEKGMTQEAVAEKLGVSGQAVSKWENGNSYPDITVLPVIAELFGITTDELLTGKKKTETYLVPVERRKKIEDMMMIVHVDSHEGDKVRVNLPLALVEVGVNISTSFPQVTEKAPGLGNIDFNQILLLAEKGMLGKLVEVESSDGDIVKVYVE